MEGKLAGGTAHSPILRARQGYSDIDLWYRATMVATRLTGVKLICSGGLVVSIQDFLAVVQAGQLS